ncbi:MAG: NAD-dependent epimerase/dehydratase family protein [Acidimicrobiales bacterium]
MKRILITGMGSEVGTRVANVLEVDPAVEIVGFDSDPPRRRVRHADFHRIDPLDRARMRELIHDFNPTELVHLGVFEPNARVGATTAATWTDAVAAATFDTLEWLGGSVERIVVRSGIEVYGRHRGTPLRPDETVPRNPTSPFGRTLALLERRAVDAGRMLGVPVTLLRCGPIVGSHLASPLGRYLRLPVVPFGVFDASFSLLHMEDAAQAVVAALGSGHDGPVNVVGSGAVTALQAARLGGRIPFPVIGPGWMVARPITELLGSPLPDHVRELLVRGRSADGSSVGTALGVGPVHSSEDVVRELYEWGELAQLAVAERAA